MASSGTGSLPHSDNLSKGLGARILLGVVESSKSLSTEAHSFIRLLFFGLSVDDSGVIGAPIRFAHVENIVVFSLGQSLFLMSSKGWSGLDCIRARLVAREVISLRMRLDEVSFRPRRFNERGVKKRVNVLGVTEGRFFSFPISSFDVGGFGAVYDGDIGSA